MSAASELYPLPLAALAGRLLREIDAGGPIYGMPRAAVWTPDPARDLSFTHFRENAGSPVGPAAGPHTQLAQNLVLSWLGGARFMELKTVQVLDELRLPRPCIHVPHVGWNVEWSQELRVEESAREYAKAWLLVHLAAERLGLRPDCIFDMSLGYDLAGLRTEKMVGFIRAMQDAGALLGDLAGELPVAVEAPRTICRSITLSTFHGCPAGEIEAIATELMRVHGLDTVVKLNPTLLGLAGVERLLRDQLGYEDVRLDPHAFEKDLQWAQLVDMVPRLQGVARESGVGFGVKFSNTLVCRSAEPPFGEGEMYLSGAPLHVLAITLAARFMHTFPGVPVTFSAGIDATNFADVVATGIRPVTTCTDLLKGKGYAKLSTYLRNLEKRMAAEGATTLDDLRGDVGAYAARAVEDPRYGRAQNKAPPKKVGTRLELLDCLTCDKCVPVCPNAAIFTFELPTGDLPGGRVAWQGERFTVTPAAPTKVTRRHQIGIVADACNQCGQCDPICPEDGGPFATKPNLFVDRRAWEEHPTRDGFLFEGDTLRWRRGGVEQALSRGGTWTVPGGVVTLDGDTPVATTGAGEADLADAALLSRLHQALTRADTWLPRS